MIFSKDAKKDTLETKLSISAIGKFFIFVIVLIIILF